MTSQSASFKNKDSKAMAV